MIARFRAWRERRRITRLVETLFDKLAAELAYGERPKLPAGISPFHGEPFIHSGVDNPPFGWEDRHGR